MNNKVDKILAVYLWLIAFHSFIVGIGLIILPSSAFEFLGFKLSFDRFFSTQGGVFHVAMSVGYGMAAYDLNRFSQLIIFTIIVKFIATIFLFVYFVVADSQSIVLLSGVSDFLMGIIVLFLYQALVKSHFFHKIKR
jgi:hypothetical protein